MNSHKSKGILYYLWASPLDAANNWLLIFSMRGIYTSLRNHYNPSMRHQVKKKEALTNKSIYHRLLIPRMRARSDMYE